MDFISELLGTQDNNIWVLAGGLAITIVAIVIVVWLLKFAFNASRNGLGGRVKRLGVISTAPVDNKRQLVIIRRDNKEHLIMIGGPTDVVIETGIDPEEASTLHPASNVAKKRAKAQASAPKTAPAAPKAKPEIADENAQATKTEPAATQAPAPAKAPPRQPIPQKPMPQAKHTPRIVPAPQSAENTAPSIETPDNVTAIDKLRELGDANPNATASTLRYPGILRPVTRHKGVDSDEIGENNAEHSRDSDKLTAQEAPKVELVQGADGEQQEKSSKPAKSKKSGGKDKG